MSLEDDLYQILVSQNYTNAKEIILQNPEFYLKALYRRNSTAPQNKPLLLAIITTHKDTDNSESESVYFDFIKFILTHPYTDMSYQADPDNRIFSTLVGYANKKIIKLFIDHHEEKGFEVFDLRGDLRFDLAVKFIRSHEYSIKQKVKNKPDYDSTDDYETLATFYEEAEMYRSAMIRKSLRHDDPTLMQRLRKAGGSIFEPIIIDDSSTVKQCPKEYATLHHKTNITAFYNEFVDEYMLYIIDKSTELQKYINQTEKNNPNDDLTESRESLAKLCEPVEGYRTAIIRKALLNDDTILLRCLKKAGGSIFAPIFVDDSSTVKQCPEQYAVSQNKTNVIALYNEFILEHLSYMSKDVKQKIQNRTAIQDKLSSNCNLYFNSYKTIALKQAQDAAKCISDCETILTELNSVKCITAHPLSI